MKRVYLAVFAAILSVSALFGQGQFVDLSGSYNGKVKYASGKNVYLMDEYKLDYNYKMVMGEPTCSANVTWTRNNSFTVNKKSMNYAKLSKHPDLKMRFDLMVPDSAVFTYTILLFSEQSNCYIASTKTSITVPYVEKAGSSVAPVAPVKLSWRESFSDVVLGKQTKEKPGVVIPDASLEKAFEADRLTIGKMDKSQKGFPFRLRKVFKNASKIEIVNVTATFKWNDANYDYIVDELNRREQLTKNYLAGNEQKGYDEYFKDRKYAPAIGINSKMFWNTTVRPVDIWMDAIKEGDRLYGEQKWDEAASYYRVAMNAAPDMVYPAARIEKIKKYKEYKANRNVGDLELVYVEGKNGMKSFYMSKTEITQAQWSRVMGTRPSSFKGRNYPVENVSWEDAQAYIKALNKETGMNYRLPRMEEWEYAAKGGAKGVSTEYAGGNNLNEVSWCAYNSGERTHEVATKTPNELGLYDMTGNVSEWVVDQYDKVTRFIKGGSWSDDASNCVISSSEKVPVKHKSNSVGFRLVQDE